MSYPRVPLGGTDWIRRAAGAINYLLGIAEPAEDAAANIASLTAMANTTGKYAGKLVWDTTNHRLMRASGSAAADVWYVVDGSASVTPV